MRSDPCTRGNIASTCPFPPTISILPVATRQSPPHLACIIMTGHLLIFLKEETTTAYTSSPPSPHHRWHGGKSPHDRPQRRHGPLVAACRSTSSSSSFPSSLFVLCFGLRTQPPLSTASPSPFFPPRLGRALLCSEAVRVLVFCAGACTLRGGRSVPPLQDHPHPTNTKKQNKQTPTHPTAFPQRKGGTRGGREGGG